MSAEESPDFGPLLQTLRRSRGWTQEDLAERAGLSTRGISDLERGARRTPQRYTAAQLADALSLSGDERAIFFSAARSHASEVSQTSTSKERGPTNLPARVTPFLGRTEEVRDALQKLRSPDLRLLTLTGTAGTGKTRLALEVAGELLHDFPDGVYFVPLAHVTDANLAGYEIARVTGARDLDRRSLGEELSSCHMLLVLDNFEHVLPAATLVSDLLQTAPHIKVLATSRASLGISAEQVFFVPPLPLPEQADFKSNEALAENPAVGLYLQRAAAVSPGFSVSLDELATIGHICLRLDGLPLAIELAAARSKLLPPAAVLGRLDRRLSLLTNGAADAPERHRTLHGAIAWSHDLLPRDAQLLFRRLSVFKGGFTLSGAEFMMRDLLDAGHQIDTLALMTTLVDRNLIQLVDRHSLEPRFSMLETLKEFGEQQLAERNETHAARAAHMRYYAGLVENLDPALIGSSQREWFHWLELEYANLRHAVEWAIEHVPHICAFFANSLIRYFDDHVQLADRWKWVQAAFESDPHAAGWVRAKLYWEIGVLAVLGENFSKGRASFEQSLAESERIEDHYCAGFALSGLGGVAYLNGEHVAGLAYFENGLEHMRLCDDIEGMAALLGNLSYGSYLAGDFDASIRYGQESLDRYRSLDSQRGAASALGKVGQSLLAAGKIHEARMVLYEGLLQSRRVASNWYLASCLESMAQLEADSGNWEDSARLFGAFDSLCRANAIVRTEPRRQMNEHYLSRIRSAIGQESLLNAWSTGASRSIDATIVDLERLSSDGSPAQIDQSSRRASI
jgi:predicted ATPase/DNA-binding XRE family transcriptional regulator